MKISIRPETTADIHIIGEVTRRAFENHPYSHDTEQFIIDALRENGVLSVSLVAEVGGRVVGHIAFSPVEVSDGSTGWFGLGPIAVSPEFQRRGIGCELMRHGLDALRELQAGGCVLVGEPAFYGRFGFRAEQGLVLEGVPPEYFMSLSFGESNPAGTVAFHASFSV